MKVLKGALTVLLAAAMTSAILPVGSAAPKASCAPVKHPGGDWPIFGHDYSNTRSQPNEKKIGPGEALSLEPAWGFSTEGRGDFTGTPIVADGCLYVGSNQGWVFALNADTGKTVWQTKLKGGINSSAAAFDGKVFVTVSRVGKPAVVALDEDNGKVVWDTTIDNQPGSDIYSSPVYFKDVIFTGWSGGSAELGDESDRYAFQGGFAIVDADNGNVIKKTYTIRPPDKNPKKPKDLYAGGAVWATPAIDTKTGFAYVGAGNPFRPQKEHRNTNSILKIDLNRGRRSFGRIVDHYKGTVDEYVPGFSDLPCYDIPGNPAPWYPQGIGQCGDLDMDFGASPNLWHRKGKTYVGEGQKSGIYHVVNAETMKPAWTAPVGPPSAVGGIVGSTAFDGKYVYGPITIGGYLWSLSEFGDHRWASPVGDGAHWGNPVAIANGVVYTIDLKGFLNAYDAESGVPLAALPLWFGGGGDLKASWGGVAIARNTVYASTGITSDDGSVIAYRPG